MVECLTGCRLPDAPGTTGRADEDLTMQAMTRLPPTCREPAGGGWGTEGQGDWDRSRRAAARNETCGAGVDELDRGVRRSTGRVRRRPKRAP